VIKFYKNTLAEAKKLSFPSWQETKITTTIITIIIGVCSLLILVVDFIFLKIINLILGF
jgi:preprotein translocase subunit SecE